MRVALRGSTSHTLDPNAPEFVPLKMRVREDAGAGGLASVTASVAAVEHQPMRNTIIDEPAPYTGPDRLSTLPDDVLAAVLACVPSPADIAYLAACCKRLHSAMGGAPLRLSFGAESGSSTVPRVLPEHDPARTSAALAGLARYKGLSELDLAGLPVEQSEVVALSHALPDLRLLQLSGCRKLKAGLLEALRGTEGAPAGCKPKAVSLQRCFQLNCGTLSDALHPGAGLSAAVLSHLQLSAWPPEPRADSASPAPSSPGSSSSGSSSSSSSGSDPEPDENGGGGGGGDGGGAGEGPAGVRRRDAAVRRRRLQGVAAAAAAAMSPVVATNVSGGGVGGGSGLRVLSLHNCTGIRAEVLAAVAKSCSRLRLLMLGGSALSPDFASLDTSFTTSATAAAAAAGDGTCHESSGLRCSSSPRLAKGKEEGEARREVRSRLRRLASAQREAGRTDEWGAAAMVELAAAALQVPGLRALELTFFPRDVTEGVRSLLGACFGDADEGYGGGTAAGSGGKGGKRGAGAGSPPAVWDLSEDSSLRSAVALLEGGSCEGRDSHTTSDSNSNDNTSNPNNSQPPLLEELGRGTLRMALRAAANCSSATRHTPLHRAAADGRVSCVTSLLLRCGADPDLRARGGNTPLFIACELGHAEVVRVLLEAGADPGVKNNAGELPLYIAALKGHGQAVGQLLRHFAARGEEWHPPHLYSERWTPLMAAVVGGHEHVALQLLAAAGKLAEQQQAQQLAQQQQQQAQQLDAPGQESRGGPDHHQGQEEEKEEWDAELGRGHVSRISPKHRVSGHDTTTVAARLLGATNRNGQTALHIAAHLSDPAGSERLLRMLLHAGAGGCLSVRDNNGRTPMQVAAQRGGGHGAVQVLASWAAKAGGGGHGKAGHGRAGHGKRRRRKQGAGQE